MTPHLRQEVMKFEKYRTQFAFLRENNISTADEMTAYQSRTKETLANLMKQRTILNVRKRSGSRCTMPWRMWRPWLRPRYATRMGCPAWRRNLPATWRPCAYWSSAASLQSI